MSGTRYIVEIDLRTVGNLQDFGTRSMTQAASGASKFESRLRMAGAAASALGGKLMGVADRVVSIGAGFAKWGALLGGGAGLGALAYGVKGINNELEKTEISLGAIFQAQGVTSGLPAGLELAQRTIAKMRIDAAKLPGEFKDLINIFTTTAIPGFQAGASVQGLADLSAKAMATGVVANMPLDQVAREFAMLLQGRSGAHNVFGMKLLNLAGDAAQAFNKKAAPERLSIIRKELDKYGDSMEAFGKSFEGQYSTAIDNTKNLLRLGTRPLFELAKENLGVLNEYLSSPAAEIFARRAGVRIREAFEWGQRKIREWWPAVQQFGINAYVKLSQLWRDIQPSVERFGAALQTALRDPGTIDKLITLLKLYVAAKAGGQLISIGGNLAMMAGGLGGLLGTGAGTALATAGGTAAGGAALAGATAGTTAIAPVAAGATGVTAAGAAAGGAAAGGAATFGGMALGGGALALSGAGLAAATGVGAYYYQLNELRKDLGAAIKAERMSFSEANRFVSHARMWYTTEDRASRIRNTNFFGATSYDSADRKAIEEWAQREVMRYRDSATAAHDFQYRIAALARKAAETGHPLDRLRAQTFELAARSREAALAIEAMRGAASSFSAHVSSVYTQAGGTKDLSRRTVKGAIGATMDQILKSQGVDPVTGKSLGGRAKGAGGGAHHGGGGGGTSIQKVEIVVTANDNPSRVARMIFDELGKVSRVRRSSPFVRNYAAG